MQPSYRHSDLLVIYALSQKPFRVTTFRPAADINAHVFVIEIFEEDKGITLDTRGFPEIRRMRRLRDEHNRPLPISKHPSRVDDWNAFAKGGALFWIPLPDERGEGEALRPPVHPGDFIVRSKNGKEICYRDKRSKLEIMDPDEGGGGGMGIG